MQMVPLRYIGPDREIRIGNAIRQEKQGDIIHRHAVDALEIVGQGEYEYAAQVPWVAGVPGVQIDPAGPSPEQLSEAVLLLVPSAEKIMQWLVEDPAAQDVARLQRMREAEGGAKGKKRRTVLHALGEAITAAGRA